MKALILALFLSSPILAQDTKPSSSTSDKTPVRVQAPQKIEIEGTTIVFEGRAYAIPFTAADPKSPGHPKHLLRIQLGPVPKRVGHYPSLPTFQKAEEQQAIDLKELNIHAKHSPKTVALGRDGALIIDGITTIPSTQPADSSFISEVAVRGRFKASDSAIAFMKEANGRHFFGPDQREKIKAERISMVLDMGAQEIDQAQIYIYTRGAEGVTLFFRPSEPNLTAETRETPTKREK